MRWRSAPVAIAAGALVLGLGAGLGIGAALDDGSDAAVTAAAAPSAVDIGFSQDMIVHHEQAVLMAQLVRGRTSDPKIAALAAGIESEQLLEIGTLRGYLALWDAPVLPAGPPMTWMADHHGHGGAMPGMATTAQLNALRAAKGAALDRMFLRLMLRHHEGGQPMLADAATNAAIPAVRALAGRISFDQAEETRTIQALLAARQQ